MRKYRELLPRLNELAEDIHGTAVKHGWWEGTRTLPEILMLCTKELASALERHRNGYGVSEIKYICDRSECDNYKIGGSCCGCENHKPSGIPIELADCIIRILDYCGNENIDIEEAIAIKCEYNRTRPYRHGGKIY